MIVLLFLVSSLLSSSHGGIRAFDGHVQLLLDHANLFTSRVWPVDGGDKDFFVLLSQQRSGTGLLRSYLESHSDILCEDELLRRPWKRLEKYDQTADFRSWASLFNTKFSLLQGRVSSGNPLKVVGFKLMCAIVLLSSSTYGYNQGVLRFLGEVSRLFKELDLKVLLLIRRNKLRQYASRWISIADSKGKNKLHTAHPTKQAEVAKRVFGLTILSFRPSIGLILLRYSYQWVQSHLSKRLRVSWPILNESLHVAVEEDKVVKEALRKLRENVHIVYYRDLLDRAHTTLAGILRFLGVPMQRLQTRLLPIHKSRAVSKSFVNWTELDAHLRASEFRKWVELDKY